MVLVHSPTGVQHHGHPIDIARAWPLWTVRNDFSSSHKPSFHYFGISGSGRVDDTGSRTLLVHHTRSSIYQKRNGRGKDSSARRRWF